MRAFTFSADRKRLLADQRTLLGVPHALNVVSNLGFLMVGFASFRAGHFRSCSFRQLNVDGKPATLRSSPVLGEHTDRVLSDWLSLSQDALGKLRSDGVLN